MKVIEQFEELQLSLLCVCGYWVGIIYVNDNAARITTDNRQCQW